MDGALWALAHVKDVIDIKGMLFSFLGTTRQITGCYRGSTVHKANNRVKKQIQGKTKAKK